jgi:hypothetical protein
VKISKQRISDAVWKVRWITWGRPNALVEPAFQAVWRRTSTHIWHDVTLTIYGCDDSALFSVETFTGSNFPSHRVWVGTSLEGDLPQGWFSSLWKADRAKGKQFVTEDGSGSYL